MSMGRLQELAGRLREREGELWEGYRELEEGTGSEVERRVAAQLVNFQRLQMATLEILAAGVPEEFLGLGRIVAEDVNLREGPGGRYPLVRKLARGELVMILGYSGYWTHVSVPRGPSGYVFKDYVQQETSA